MTSPLTYLRRRMQSNSIIEIADFAESLDRVNSEAETAKGTRLVSSLCGGHFEGEPGCTPSFNAVDQNANVAGAFTQKNASRGRCPKSFMAVHEAWLRWIDALFARFKIKQRNRDRTRQVPLQ